MGTHAVAQTGLEHRCLDDRHELSRGLFVVKAFKVLCSRFPAVCSAQSSTAENTASCWLQQPKLNSGPGIRTAHKRIPRPVRMMPSWSLKDFKLGLLANVCNLWILEPEAGALWQVQGQTRLERSISKQERGLT